MREKVLNSSKSQKANIIPKLKLSMHKQMLQEFKDLQIVLDSRDRDAKNQEIKILQKKFGIKPKDKKIRRLGKRSTECKASFSVRKKTTVAVNNITARSVQKSQLIKQFKITKKVPTNVKLLNKMPLRQDKDYKNIYTVKLV